MQEWHLLVRDGLERKTLHDGRLPEFLFRARTVQSQQHWPVGVQVLRWLGWQGLQRIARAELQRRARQ